MRLIIFFYTYIFSIACFATPHTKCVASLEQLITGSTKAKNFEFSTTVNGKKTKLRGSLQNEIELRIQLPSNTPAEELLTTFLRNFKYDIGGFQQPQSELPAGFKSIERGLRLNPLKSDTETWHGSAFDPSTNFEGQFSKRINTRTEDLPSGDVTQQFAVVGAQFEISDYFDTRNSYFQKQGIAIRIKTWYPYKVKPYQEFKPSGQSLFIKVNRPQKHLFHERVELQIPLTQELTLGDLDNIVRAALKKQGINTPSEFELEHLVGIINQRLTVHLNYSTVNKKYNSDIEHAEEKIGFITFDSFFAASKGGKEVSLTSDANAFSKKGSHHQIEIEFTENGQKIIKQNPKQWDEVFKGFAKEVNGKLTKTPKYLEALKGSR